MNRPRAFLDIECFSNWFLVGVTDDDGNRWELQQTDTQPLDVNALASLLNHFTIYTFNGMGYDVPMAAIALSGASCAMLKQANDDIIVKKMFQWQVLKKYGAKIPTYVDHIDIAEPTPGVKLTLKQYAGRCHAPEMIETPVDFSMPMSIEHIPQEIKYCGNDRQVTRIMVDQQQDRLAMRIRMSEKYGVDVRSKSDAQIAEAVIKAEVIRIILDSEQRWKASGRSGIHELPNSPEYTLLAKEFPHLAADYTRNGWGDIKILIPQYQHGTTFKAKIPDYIEFATPYMQEFLQVVRDADFFISSKEEAEFMGMDGKKIKTGVMIPDVLKGRDIVIGNTTYRVGIGGLHSQESKVSYYSIPGVQTLRTADVASYYPTLILNAGMSPKQLGNMFLDIYLTIYKTRLAAKAAAKKHGLSDDEYKVVKTEEGGYKIVLNGTFGKLFSRHSIFYAPEFGIAVTIGGQLSLLMLIERLQLSGIRVISANTDGIEMLVPAGKEWVVKMCMDWWMTKTKLVMEEENYKSLHSRDVNNYISVGFDGKVKRKGVFRPSGLVDNKHPDCDICADAVVEFITKGVPPIDTVLACTDIRKFIRVRGVKNGGVYCQGPENGSWGYILGEREWVPKPTKRDPNRGEWFQPRIGIWGAPYLGRAVRWYYSKVAGFIADKDSTNKVAGSENAMPCMTLPDHVPGDLDRQAYVDMAEQMLEDLGYGLSV